MDFTRSPAACLLSAELLAVGYISVIATIADVTGAFYVLFPELAALAYNVLTRPRGRWARAPLHLATSAVITGAIGIVITRTLPYGLLSVMLSVLGALAVLLTLGSPIAPAISAGLLPLVLNVTSFWYPPGVFLGTLLLTGLSAAWGALLLRRNYIRPSPDEARHIENHREVPALYWVLPLFAFIALAVGCVHLTGQRFLLFPPLVVIAYEMMRHPASCAWASKPQVLPLACFLAAAGGLLSHDFVGANPLGAVVAMAWGTVVLRALKVHVPPALAVALIPMVMNAPTVAYPVAVAAGTGLMTAWYFGFLKLLPKRE